MQTLHELRTALKQIGFTVATRSRAGGQHATYVHVATGARLDGAIFTAEARLTWKPLWAFLEAHAAEVKTIAAKPRVYGLTNPGGST